MTKYDAKRRGFNIIIYSTKTYMCIVLHASKKAKAVPS